MIKVLVVGAGAVGRVYGSFLQKGGAEVTYFVRPGRVEELSGGMTLFALNRPKASRLRPTRVTGFGVTSSQEQVKRVEWDYVIPCLHAGALQTPWFRAFAAALPKNATIVNLHPDLEERAAILEYFPEDQVIDGLITLVSYSAPLPGESVEEPGTAFWFPPFTRVPFRGPHRRLAPLLEAFRRGGFPCRELTAGNAASDGMVPDSVLSTFVLALEGAGWKFESFLQPGQARLAKAAIFETLDVQARLRGLGRPRWTGLRLLLGRPFFAGFLGIAQRLMPFDLETYLKAHFTKVADQRRLGLESTLMHARELGVPAPALESLARQTFRKT